MSLVDLSKFKQNFVKDTEDDLKEIAAMKQMMPIPEGIHEVTVVGIHEKKDGAKFKIDDKLGGTLGFSLIVKNIHKQEQLIYICIPLIVTFLQARRDTDRSISFTFKRAIDTIQAMGINPIHLRESIITSNGTAAELLIGTQFVLTNYWDPKKVHLEYDSIAKAHFFATAQGERFSSGEMALPCHINSSIAIEDRYKEFVAIAHENHYEFTNKMNTTYDSHPTANNNIINEALEKACVPKEQKKPLAVNKIIPNFPVQVKRPAVPIDTEPDIEL